MPDDSGRSWLGCLEEMARSKATSVQIYLGSKARFAQIQSLKRSKSRGWFKWLNALLRGPDLRYALSCASRKDRKKGLKGLSRLLNQ